jgi:hypothetical protein
MVPKIKVLLVAITCLVSVVGLSLDLEHPTPARSLKQATRQQIVTRASRSRALPKRQTSAAPFPDCPGFVKTGFVPYANYFGVDIAGTPDVYTITTERSDCNRRCESDPSECSIQV